MGNKSRVRQLLDTNEVHQSNIPSRDFRYQDKRFRGPANIKNMNVNGSGTPIDFVLGPGASEIWLIEYLTLLIIDPGVMGEGVFGSLAAPLANGLELIESINTVENIYTALEDNADIAQCFFGGLGASLSPGPSDPGFLETVDKVLGRMEFRVPIMLDGAQNDKLIIRVNDDLLLLQFMAASAHIRIPKLIPA